MGLRPAPQGKAPAERFPQLEARFGPLTPMGQGMQSRVYATVNDPLHPVHHAPAQSDAAQQHSSPPELVVKVYRTQRGEHRHEAENMRRAGLGAWVVEAAELDGVEALILRRFQGHPLERRDVPLALPRLREILGQLHAQQQGQVNISRVQERLRRFRSALSAYPLEDLFEAIELPLERGLLHGPASFCHLDLWHDNILINRATEDVLVIDWTKAGWDDPLRDLALLKTGTLDLLPADAALSAALSFLPDQHERTLKRYRAYLALTTLHDLYWFLMNAPYEFEGERDRKLPRTRHALARLPAEVV